MQVLKGQRLAITHSRKGEFNAIALEDFDTETAEWYPVATVDNVKGNNKDWEAGEEIPCRASFARFIKVIANK